MKKCKDCTSRVEQGKSMCRVCLDKNSARVNKLRRDAIAKGLCGKCRERNPLTGKTKCQKCFDIDKKRHSDRVEKYLSENRCSKCGYNKGNTLIWYNVWCPYCQLKYKFKFPTDTKQEADQVINDLLTEQNFKCALTGRDLHKNKFHIDHIVPRSNGGTDDPSNWQLIVEEANVFKTNISMQQIIKLAKDIAQNFE